MEKRNKYVEYSVELDLSYEEFIENLNEKYELLKEEGVEGITIEYDYDSERCVVICGTRLETDKEFNDRISRETAEKEFMKNNMKNMMKEFSKNYPDEFKEIMKEF